MISIVIPTFNRVDPLRETINSIKSQSTDGWECIIVDDWSEESNYKKIMELVSDDSRFIVKRRPSHRLKGPSSCRNFGVELSTFNLVMFLDSDDVLKNDSVKIRTETYNKNPSFLFYIFPMSMVDEQGVLETKYIEDKKTDELINDFVSLNFPWNVTAPMYKKEYFNSVRGFDESLSVFEDPELAIRILLNSNHNYNLFKISDSLYKLDNQIKKSKTSYFNSLNKFYDKIYALKFIGNNSKAQRLLRNRFFKIINGNRINNQNKLEFKLFLKRIKRFFLLTYKQKIGIKLIIFLNTFFYKKKGYYLIKKIINNHLLE